MQCRFAMLAVALRGTTSAFAQTATKGPTTIDAQTIEGVSDLEVTARGRAEIRRDDTTIFGEVLRYNREFGRVEGEGGVRLEQGVDRFFGPRLQYNTLDDTGVFEQPQFLLQRERPARGGAERMEFAGKDRYLLKNATFTTCRPGQEDWQLEADELDLNYATEEGEARGLRLRFFGVPIIGAPWASFPLENRRKSGLLSPYYAQTSTRGAEFGLPFYWNMAPERDMVITPVYMSKRGAQLKSSLRYLDSKYAGELRLEYMPEDKVFGSSRSGTTLQHAHDFSPELTARLDYNRVSDNRYFVDMASQVRQVSSGNLPQDANLTYNGLLAGAAPLTAQVRMQRFQTLQDPLTPTVPPYHRVPQVKLNAGMYGMGGFLDTTLPAEYVRFAHQNPGNVEGSRIGATPTLAGAFVAPGWYLTPKVGMRTVGYGLERNAPGTPNSASLAIPWLSVDSGLTLERDTSWFDNRLTQTLEPRMFYVYIPFHKQDHIPLFDTVKADFNYPQLFNENRFVGGDRFGDANQLTLALSSRFLRTDGQEAFRATVGQRFYFHDERVGVPGEPLRVNTESSVLASVGGRVFQHWAFDATTEYDRLSANTQRYQASVRYTPEVAKVVNFTYRFNRAQIRQLDVSTQWPVSAGWYGVARYNYSLQDGRLLEGLGGLEFNAGCWVFRTVVQRIQAATRVSSTALIFQVEFTGVGQLGTDEAVELLKRSVPGYSVTNPSDPSLAPPGARPLLPFQQVY